MGTHASTFLLFQPSPSSSVLFHLFPLFSLLPLLLLSGPSTAPRPSVTDTTTLGSFSFFLFLCFCCTAFPWGYTRQGNFSFRCYKRSQIPFLIGTDYRGWTPCTVTGDRVNSAVERYFSRDSLFSRRSGLIIHGNASAPPFAARCNKGSPGHCEARCSSNSHCGFAWPIHR